MLDKLACRLIKKTYALLKTFAPLFSHNKPTTQLFQRAISAYRTTMKNALLFLGMLLLTAAAHAQEDETLKKGFQTEKLFLGGNFGLTFGDYTFINVSPQLGYRFNKSVAAGFGINAQHVRFKDWDNGELYRQRQTIFGLNLFGRVYPIPNLMLQAQPEVNYSYGKRIFNGPPKQEYLLDATIAPSLLLGGGAVLPSGRGELLLSIFYDVLQDKASPYGRRPIYNFGYIIGF